MPSQCWNFYNFWSKLGLFRQPGTYAESLHCPLLILDGYERTRMLIRTGKSSQKNWFTLSGRWRSESSQRQSSHYQKRDKPFLIDTITSTQKLKSILLQEQIEHFWRPVGSYPILSMRPTETSLPWSKIMWLNMAPMTLWPFIERMKFAVRMEYYFWSGVCWWLRLLLHSRDGCRDFRDALFVLSTTHVGDIRYQMRCRN